MTAAARDGVVKRSVAIAGHRTSVSLEQPFWDALNAIAREQGRSVSSLIGEIDGRRGPCNLSSALRVFVLASVQARTDAERAAAIGCENQPPGRAGS